MPRRLVSDDDDFEPPRKRMVPTAVPYGSPPICSLTELARSMGKNSRQWSSQQYNMGGYKPAYTAFNTASNCGEKSSPQIPSTASVLESTSDSSFITVPTSNWNAIHRDIDQMKNELQSINGNVQKIMETLEYMKSSMRSMAATIAGQPGQQATQLPLPITSVEELQSFDILMQDAGRRQQLVGGFDTSHMHAAYLSGRCA
ncbi:unnamed protein product, partial [Dicrocoelium dendriticum]